MNRFSRTLVALVSASALVLVTGSSALAHECFNISKNANNPGAGAQVVIDANTGEIVDATNGVIKRVEMGLIDPDTGEGFHGLIGLDFDGDGEADASTYIVTPEDELPEVAQENGADDQGIVNICVLFGCP